MHYHWTNDNHNGNHKVVAGSGLWAGRAWLHLNEEGGWQEKKMCLEWRFGKHAKHTMIQVHTSFVFEKELTFGLGIWGLFTLFLTLALPIFPHWKRDRQTGIRVFDNAIWIDIWSDPNEWRSKDPFWRKTICIHPADIVLGRAKHSRADETEHRVTVQMPEGEYPAKVTMFTSVWKRPRWPFAKTLRRAEIEPETPIPFPGKGENSWDIDDDATYSMTCPASTPEEAANKLRESVMRDRVKYGGISWMPSSN